jgi:phage terminase small subunit
MAKRILKRRSSNTTTPIKNKPTKADLAPTEKQTETNNIKTVETLPGYKPLKGKKELLCQEYIVDMNIRAAGERAAYKVTSNGGYVYEVMKEPAVLERIAYLQWQRMKRTQITQDRVLQEMANIGLFNVKDLYKADGTMKEIGSLTREEAAAITGIDVTEDITGMKTKKIKFDGKVSALVKVGQHLGMFKDGRDTVDPMMLELRQRKADMKENLS